MNLIWRTSSSRGGNTAVRDGRECALEDGLSMKAGMLVMNKPVVRFAKQYVVNWQPEFLVDYVLMLFQSHYYYLPRE
jgi:hypothetical protein